LLLIHQSWSSLKFLFFQSSALAGPSSLQLVLDLLQDSSLVFAPLRCQQEISRGFPEESLDRDRPGKVFKKIANTTEVLGVPQWVILASTIDLCQGCAPNHMAMVDLHALDGQAGKNLRGLHHIRMRFPGKAQDDVCADLDRSARGSSHGVQKVLHPVPAPDAIQGPVVCALQPVLHPNLVILREGFEQVEDRLVRAVRPCAYRQADDLGVLPDQAVTLLQEFHGAVRIRVGLEIGEEAAGAVSLLSEANALGELLVKSRETLSRATVRAERGILTIDAARPPPVVDPVTMRTSEARIQRYLVYPPAVFQVEIITKAVISNSRRLACTGK
jgi:hypothetical protein